MASLFVIAEWYIKNASCVSSRAWVIPLQFYWIGSFHGRMISRLLRCCWMPVFVRYSKSYFMYWNDEIN